MAYNSHLNPSNPVSGRGSARPKSGIRQPPPPQGVPTNTANRQNLKQMQMQHQQASMAVNGHGNNPSVNLMVNNGRLGAGDPAYQQQFNGGMQQPSGMLRIAPNLNYEEA